MLKIGSRLVKPNDQAASQRKLVAVQPEDLARPALVPVADVSIPQASACQDGEMPVFTGQKKRVIPARCTRLPALSARRISARLFSRWRRGNPLGFIRHGQLLTTFAPPAGKHGASVRRGHPLAESVFVGSAAPAGLVGPFHRSLSPNRI